MTRLEPTTAIAALSLATRHLGLGATVSTSFSEPYTVARTFQSLQHLSQGRIAWNVVTSSSDIAARNFSMRAPLRARQTLRDRQRVRRRGARPVEHAGTKAPSSGDKETGVYVDPAKVRTLDHKGRYFQVRGPAQHRALRRTAIR